MEITPKEAAMFVVLMDSLKKNENVLSIEGMSSVEGYLSDEAYETLDGLRFKIKKYIGIT